MNMTTGLTLGQIFGRTMQLFRDGFTQVLVGIVLPLGLATGLMSASIAAMQSRPDFGTAAMGPSFGVNLILFALAFLFAIVVGVVGVGALAHSAMSLTAGRPVNVGESWRQGLRFRVWGTTMLSSMGIFLGCMCCLLPGLYLLLAWSLALPIVFEEARFHSAAISRSHQLASFNPQGGIGNDPRFRMFLLYGATFATMYILSFLVALPMYIVMFVTIARSTAEGQNPNELPAFVNWLQVPTSILSSLVQSSMTFMGYIGAAVIYFDIRGRQEAGDIAAAIDDLGTKRDA